MCHSAKSADENAQAKISSETTGSAEPAAGSSGTLLILLLAMLLAILTAMLI